MKLCPVKRCGKIVPNVEKHMRVVHPKKKETIVPVVIKPLLDGITGITSNVPIKIGEEE